jgi:two-component system, OmpR family, aerobic respiration control sensor histidine kinase ArcB
MMSRHDPFPESWAGPVLGRRILFAGSDGGGPTEATEMLRSLGAEVIFAADGSEALESFEQSPFDLVVLDIDMPHLTGLDVVRAIRARPDRRSGTPVVALTSHATPEHRDRIAAAGADALIPKPLASVSDFGQALAFHIRPAQPGGDAHDSPSAAPEGPVIDMTVFEGLAAALGAETMAELLENVKSDLASAEAALVEAIRRSDTAAIRATSHILIAIAGAIGAYRLQFRARRLNSAAQAGEQDGLAAKVCACLGEINAVMAFAGREAVGG